MKKLKFALSILLVVFSFFSSCLTTKAIQPPTSATGTEETPYQSYTYWEDYNAGEKTSIYTKRMYSVKKTISSREIPIDENSKLIDVASDLNKNVYILDSGNSKIFVLKQDYSLIKVITEFDFNGEKIEFKDARGITVINNCIYVADTENQRVLVADMDGNIVRILTLPESELIPTNYQYKPIKVAVDSKGYIYIASDSSYNGAILYSPKMEFLGFFGSNTVKASALNVLQNIWKRFTMSDIKRAADRLSLPYAFTDIVAGQNDFIYTSTGRKDENEIQYGQICVFNPGGIGVENTDSINFADIRVGTYELNRQVQNIADIAVDENGFIFALDTTYGRIFWYDSEFNLFSVFGGNMGSSDQKGTFSVASAISINGDDVLVTDSKKNTLTIFGITDYAQKVKKAQIRTLNGDYDGTISMWQEVVKEDLNCQIAYRGLAKIFYYTGEFDEALKYAKIGLDRDIYGKAFKEIRTDYLEKSAVWIFFGLIILIGAFVLIRIKFEKKQYVFKINEEIKLAIDSVFHPVESFGLIKEKQRGSMAISVSLMISLYLSTILKDTCGGFAFTSFDAEKYNALYVLLSTTGLIVLSVISNWLVCTLAGGIGKIREIFYVLNYSLIPIIFSNVISLILTHIFIPSEAAFLSVFQVVCICYSAFMLIIGLMRIHDYGFGKFIGTTIFTVIVILIMIFFIFLIFLLFQQIFSWFATLFLEAVYR